VSPPRQTNQPHDRLTRIANDVGAGLFVHRHYKRGDRIIIMIMDDHHDGGIGILGYQGSTSEDVALGAMADAILHLREMFKANGRQLSIVPLKARGRG
jgi:hypothetical protein